MSQFFTRIFSNILSKIERLAGLLNGKGWGTATVIQELNQVLQILPNKELTLCIDVGGNIGEYTEQIIKKFNNCKVVIFEPSDTNIKILNGKFSNNKMIRIESCGLSSTSSTATLWSDVPGAGTSSVYKRNLKHFGIFNEVNENIELIDFESYWKETLGSCKIDFCKIDVEGLELEVLKGMGAALNYIDVIQFEFGGTSIDSRNFFQDYWYFFKEKKWDLYRISPIGTVPIKNYTEDLECFLTTNFLAKRVIY